jgi:hypothetical protein
MQTKRKNISVRMTAWELKRVKEIADRLGVKESEMIRYSISNTLGKLMPFHDKAFKGANLMPAILDSAEDLMRYFHMDSDQLNRIVNEGEEDPSKRVAEEDLDMIVLSHLNEQYLVKRLAEIFHSPIESMSVGDKLKTYLYEKYVLVNNKQTTF